MRRKELCPACLEVELTYDCQGTYCEGCGEVHKVGPGSKCKEAGDKCSMCQHDYLNPKIRR